MPIPKPNAGENRDDFVSRCVSAISGEYDNDEAVAICIGEWGSKAAPDELSEGDYVSWDSSGGRAQGQIESIERDGEINVPDADVTVNGTEDDPAALIRVFTDGEPTDTLVGHRFSTLTKIDPIKAETLDGDSEQKASYSDYPEAAKNNAQRALDIREETGNPNDCGTSVGWGRAKSFANGEAFSREDVGSIASFERFREDSTGDPKEECGPLMWLAWGGDEGVEWAQSKLDEIENEKNMSNIGSLYNYKQPSETKEFGFIVKEHGVDEVNKVATIKGYGAIFGNVDLGNDMIPKGAFKKTLEEKGNKVYFLADHQYNLNNFLGVATVTEDEVGLFGEFEINLETQKGREAYSQARQAKRHGLPLGMSIGFDIMSDDMDQKTQIRLLKEIRLHEISLTMFPMNPKARVTEAKTMQTELVKLQELIDSLHKSKPSPDTSNDEAEAKTIIENLIKSLQDERTK